MMDTIPQLRASPGGPAARNGRARRVGRTTTAAGLPAQRGDPRRPLRARRGLAGMWGGRTGGPLHAGIIRRFRRGPLRSPVNSSILHSRIGCSLFSHGWFRMRLRRRLIRWISVSAHDCRHNVNDGRVRVSENGFYNVILPPGCEPLPVPFGPFGYVLMN